MTRKKCGPRLIITGPIGSGKTTHALELVGSYRTAGRSVGGVVSLHLHADPEDPRNESYRFRLLSSGQEHTFARRSSTPTPPSRRYAFDSEAFEKARAELLRPPEDIMVVDECGPLELEGRGLWQPLSRLWHGFPGELLVTVRESLLDSLLEALGTDRQTAERPAADPKPPHEPSIEIIRLP